MIHPRFIAGFVKFLAARYSMYLVHTVVALVFAVNCQEVFGQGFNWQYSAREPTSYPRLFIGITGSGALSQHFGQLQFAEKLGGDTCIICADYTQGRGTAWSLGIHTEYWLESGDIALYGSVRYDYARARFAFERDNGPWRGAPNRAPQQLITEWSLETEARSVLLDVGVKWKMFPLPIFAVGGVQGGYGIFFTSQQQERKISPAEHPFERQIIEGIFPQFQPIIIAGKLAFGADVPLANGLYASPAVFGAIALTNAARVGQWHWLHYGIQISLVYGWLPPREE
jgi:hypothetical protein